MSGGRNDVVLLAGAVAKVTLPDGTEVTVTVDCSKAKAKAGNRPVGGIGTTTEVSIPRGFTSLTDLVPLGDDVEIVVAEWGDEVRILVPAGAGLDLTDPGLRTLPVTARMVVPAEGEDRFRPLLGQDCNLDAVLVNVLDSSDTSVRLLVLPQDGCTPRQLAVEPTDIELQPVAEPVACGAAECTVASSIPTTTVPNQPGGGTGVTSG